MQIAHAVGRMMATRTVRMRRRSIHAPATLLNASQREHLSSLAAGIEDALTEIERLLDPHLNSDSALTRVANDLPCDFDERVRPMLEALRAKITVFAEQFCLDSRSLSRSNGIAANVLSQVIQLDETGETQLREYGIVAPPLERVLAPALEQLRLGFSSIGALLSPRAESPPYGLG